MEYCQDKRTVPPLRFEYQRLPYKHQQKAAFHLHILQYLMDLPDYVLC